MDKIKILFLCVHNSARSQMAEAYMKKFGSERFDAESAGLEPGKLNPLAVEVMREDGIDISNNPTKDVFELFKQGKTFFYVITVCDAGSSDRCPVFPGAHKKINWDLADPSKATGTHEEQLAQTRVVRDKIKRAVQLFIKEVMSA
jgi:arsenate reductase (thioredoxin)